MSSMSISPLPRWLEVEAFGVLLSYLQTVALENTIEKGLD